MSNRLEDRIRDYLAAHLELLDESFTLIEKEFSLPNTAGAGGKIDILARDKFRNIVVIEIKRSDKTARQTLNEIFKYTGLLRNNMGLAETQVRIVVVSTDWHELRLPLSEFAEVSPYTVDPFMITVLPDGTVINAQRVTLPPRISAIQISRVQSVYLFRDASSRDAALPKLVGASLGASISDFAVLKLNCVNNNPQVIYPFALYLFFSSPLSGATGDDTQKMRAQMEWVEGLDQPDENFLVAIGDQFGSIADTSEIGYPEKLATILRDWSVTEFSRHGRCAANPELLTNDDLLLLAQATQGGSPLFLNTLCTPKHVAVWNQMLDDITLTLKGIPEWEEIVPMFLSEVASGTPNATVSIYVYNPANLLMSLYPIAWAEDASMCPFLDIGVDAGNGMMKSIMSTLTWNGKLVTDSSLDVIDEVFGGLNEWMVANHLHETFEEEPAMMEAHGLEAHIIEFAVDQRGHDSTNCLKVSEENLFREPFQIDSLLNIGSFAEANREYLNDLRYFMESIIGGLPGSDLQSE